MEHLWSPWRMHYIQTPQVETGCIFCQALSVEDNSQNLVVVRGERVFTILNRYPYTSGHLMVVPFQHAGRLEDLETLARAELMEMAAQSTRVLQQAYHPQGFNLGINMGAVAGAGVADHIHLHVVPRWGGDTNFMSAISNTRVLPEALEDTYQRIKAAWQLTQEESDGPHQPVV